MKIEDYITIPLPEIQNFYENGIDLSVILSHPGVLGVHCFPANRTLVFDSVDCWCKMCQFCDDLIFERTIDAVELSGDKNTYGLDKLSFVIFAIGPKWQTFSERKKTLDEIKKHWEHPIYPESEFYYSK